MSSFKNVDLITVFIPGIICEEGFIILINILMYFYFILCRIYFLNFGDIE